MNARHSNSKLTGLRTAWLALSAREQRLLLAAGLFLLLVGMVLVVGWGHNERHRLLRALPLAEARLAQMQQASDERLRLQAQPLPPRLDGAALLAALQSAAAARALTLSLQPTGEGVLVKGQGAFDAGIAWLADVQRDHTLRPARLEILRDGSAARFEATLVFAAP